MTTKKIKNLTLQQHARYGAELWEMHNLLNNALRFYGEHYQSAKEIDILITCKNKLTLFTSIMDSKLLDEFPKIPIEKLRYYIEQPPKFTGGTNA